MSALIALAGVEARLLTREWAAMVFAFVFPPLMMVVLAGVFASGGPDVAYDGANGTDYYVAAYLGVPAAALSLVGLPVMLASYRERGVLRRLEAFGVRTLLIVTAQALVTALLIALAAVLVLAVAAPVYGLPAVGRPVPVAVGFVAGTVTMVLLGVALSLAAPTARAAQALGLLVFMPMWLLGGGGPPRGVMTPAMRHVSDLMPLQHVTAAIREPWLQTGAVGDDLLALGAWSAIALVLITLGLRGRPRRRAGATG